MIDFIYTFCRFLKVVYVNTTSHIWTGTLGFLFIDIPDNTKHISGFVYQKTNKTCTFFTVLLNIHPLIHLGHFFLRTSRLDFIQNVLLVLE